MSPEDAPVNSNINRDGTYSIVMSGRRSQIKGSLPWREVRGCGHVSGLLVRDGAPLALMVSAGSFA